MPNSCVTTPLSLHCLDTLHEQFFIYCHFWFSVCSGICLHSQNGLPCHIVNISRCMLGIFFAHMSSNRNCSLWVSLLIDSALSNVLFFCLCLLMMLTSLLSFVASMSAFNLLYTSTLLAQVNTCSLLISFVLITVLILKWFLSSSCHCLYHQ